MSSNMANFLTSMLLTFLLIPSSNSLSFNISSFDSNTSLIFEGDGELYNGAINLNRVDYMYRIGRVMYVKQIQMYDPSTKRASDFATNFSFTIDTLQSTRYGYGFSFFFAPVDTHIPVNSVGGFQGLYNSTTLASPSNNHIIAVEFDSYVNSEWDPPYEHVGINVNSLKSDADVRWNSSLHSGQIGRAMINYNSTTKGLNVSISYDGLPQVYNLNSQIDLMASLTEWVLVGFTGTTGFVTEQHMIHSWEFSSTFDTQPKNTSTSYNKEKHGNIKESTKWLVLSSVSTGLLFLTLFLQLMFWLWRRNKAKKVATREVTPPNVCSFTGVLDGAWPRSFSYQDLLRATNNFSIERKLGQGGFGPVYKGVLSEKNLEVAVKKISTLSKQGKREYLTEILIISSLRHRNLVRLIGWCHDQGEFMLVYEFMPNGSLDSHLFGNKTNLSWSVRHKVALGLASALLYLHEEWEQCVIHRDIKSSNVMLDSEFLAKLGDFGLARLMDHEVSLKTTALAGTWGYLAPEYISRGKASKESDVYSFGVVALEIACGRRSVEHDVEEESRVRLVEWVWSLYAEGRIFGAVDQRLGGVYDVKQMESLIVVGLWCAHPDHTMRPSIKEAIQALNFEASLPELPLVMPVPVYGAIPCNSGHRFITSTGLDDGR